MDKSYSYNPITLLTGLKFLDYIFTYMYFFMVHKYIRFSKSHSATNKNYLSYTDKYWHVVKVYSLYLRYLLTLKINFV